MRWQGALKEVLFPPSFLIFLCIIAYDRLLLLFVRYCYLLLHVLTIFFILTINYL